MQGQESRGEGNGSGRPSASARKLLKFSTPRDPAQLAAFINLRVLNPEHEHWRRGVEAAVIFAREQNARAAARKAAEIEQRRAEGLPVESSAGALAAERRKQLEDIDPSWCPAWPVEWQRAFHLVRLHLEEGGGELPSEPGDVLHQGEALGRWVRSVRLGWDNLTTVQQWMCEQVLGIEPVAEDEKPPPRRTQADKWAMNYKGRQAVLRARGTPSGTAQAH
ncbi:hypothetical protein [Streptomyces kronopolitis]|uniref:hypothetical protein n=1 Tax=Streptomyces kronopolitis TaxID=1612435 RepID=UPI003D9812DD